MTQIIKKYRFILLIFALISCESKIKVPKPTSIEKPANSLFDNYTNDSIRDLNFKTAYNNNSTTPNYIVFRAKNLNTGQTKEICSEAPFLSGAMHRELNIKYELIGEKYIDSLILVNSREIFHFKNKNVLKIMNFNNYPDYDSIVKIAKNIDLEYYLKNDSLKLMHFGVNSKVEQTTFAHILFNCGINTKRDCIAGNNIWIEY